MRAVVSLRRLRRKDGTAAVLFLAPSVIGFSLFFVVPFVAGFYYSLVDSPVNGHFAGLANYRDVLASDSFRRAAWNTSWFIIVGVPLLMGTSLALAVLLNRNRLSKLVNDMLDLSKIQSGTVRRIPRHSISR